MEGEKKAKGWKIRKNGMNVNIQQFPINPNTVNNFQKYLVFNFSELQNMCNYNKQLTW